MAPGARGFAFNCSNTPFELPFRFEGAFPMSDVQASSSTARLSDGIWDVIAFREVHSASYQGDTALWRAKELIPLAGGFLIGADHAGRVVAAACCAPGLGVEDLRVTRSHMILCRPIKFADGDSIKWWPFDKAGDPPKPYRRHRRPDGSFADGAPMHDAVRLLRLIRPHFIGYGMAARISITDGAVVRVSPHRVDGAGGSAFINPHPALGEVGFRDVDFASFNALWQAYHTFDVPRRVETAAQWYERACWEHDGSIRIPLLVTALECLVNTSPSGATSHFVLRLQEMIDRGLVASHVWAGRELEAAYGLRSALLHGRLNLKEEEKTSALSLLNKLDVTARILIHRAILDSELRSLFSTAERIDQAIPANRELMRAWRKSKLDLPPLSWMT